MTLSYPQPVFQGHYLQVEYLKKRCLLETKLLKNTNRKLYTIYILARNRVVWRITRENRFRCLGCRPLEEPQKEAE